LERDPDETARTVGATMASVMASSHASHTARRLNFEATDDSVHEADLYTAGEELVEALLCLEKPRNSDEPLEPDEEVPLLRNASASEANHRGRGAVSIVFSLWNTMVGGGLLMLPWSFAEAGCVAGVLLTISIACVCAYTAYLLYRHGRNYDDISLVALKYFGKKGQVCVSVVVALLVMGVFLAYDVMATDCVYQSAMGLHDFVHGSSTKPVEEVATKQCMTLDFSCWSRPKAGIILTLVLFGLSLVKHATTLIKINSFGVLSIMYLIVFIIVQSVIVGPVAPQPLAVTWISPSFPRMGGILVGTFFIHHAILPVLKTAHHTVQRGRCLFVAYILAAITYGLPGLLGQYSLDFIRLRLSKHGYRDGANFLSAFETDQPYAFSARVAMGLQLVTVLPLLLYIARRQMLGVAFHGTQTPFWIIVMLNAALLLLGFGCIIGNVGIGSIMRYASATGGFLLLFLFPVSVHLRDGWINGSGSKRSTWGHVFLVALGLALSVGQFLPLKTHLRDASWPLQLLGL